MKILLALFLLSLSSFAFSAESAFSIPGKDRPAIESQIRNGLHKEAGITLQGFKVKWSAIRCSQPIKTERDPAVTMGVCTGDASAFQVQAKFAIVKTYQGYRVSMIYVDVE